MMRQLLLEKLSLKNIAALLLSPLFIALPLSSAYAWSQLTLPESSVASQSAHYGGSHAPLELAAGSLLVGRVSHSGANVWSSIDAGANWSAASLSDVWAEHARVLSAGTAITWARYREPVIHTLIGTSWSAMHSSTAWPLARSWPLDAAESGADVLLLASDARPGRLIEGPLYLVRYAGGQWQTPVLLSSAGVGDARLVQHASGMWTAVWSERAGNDWRIMLANSYDGGATWGTSMQVVAGIKAPLAQESAVQVAAAALPGDKLALAFTGWAVQPYSQIWAKQVDAVSGAGSNLALLPDAGDMVYSPSVAVEADGRWEVVWQQKTGIDMEVYLAERSAAGVWSTAVNVSSDPLHLNYDAHLATGLTHEVQVAYTSTTLPGQAENYQLSMGAASDPSQDSDGDGIPDSEEAGYDMDQDGIDDAQSAKVATWAHVDGRYTLISEAAGSLSLVQSLDKVSAHVSDPANYLALSDMISFKVVGLATGGQAQLHLMTPHAVPADAKWMKWNPAGSWQDAGVPVWRDSDGTGLHIVLTDGGLGDEDGTLNGEIADPGMLAAPNSVNAPAPAAGGGGGGGCLISVDHPLSVSLMLLWMAGLLGLACRKPA